MTRLVGGEQKDVWRVDTPGEVRVLRVYPPFVRRWSVERECRWLAGLSATVPEVPKPVPSTSGHAVVVEGGRCAVLAPFVDGEPVDDRRPAHRRAMSNVLARVHAAASRLDTSGESVFPALRDLDWQSNAWWDVPTIERVVADTELWRLVRPRLAEVDGLVAAGAGLPTQVIHNDFGVVNVLMHEDAVAGVVDWDWATVDWRLIDVAHGLRTVSVHGPAFDVARARSFVADYVDGSGELLHEELRFLADLLRLQITWVACYDLGRACAGRLDDDSMAYRVMTLKAVDDLAAAMSDDTASS